MSNRKNAAKRKASDLEVPKRGEDSAERKRILNILAQRRYRQRRREHLKKLEANAEGRSDLNEELSAQSQDEQSPTFESDPIPEQLDNRDDQTLPELIDSIPIPSTAFDLPQDFQHSFPDIPFDNTSTEIIQVLPDTQMTSPIDASELNTCDPTYLSLTSRSWDFSFNTPTLSNSSNTTPASLSSPQQSTLSSDTEPDPSEIEQCKELQYSFPDEANFEVLELNLLRGATAIAKRLNIEELIWSLTSTSPFTEPSMALAQFNHLPTNLQPTLTQLTVPHHPVIDLLPWPGVRNKLIMVFSQPPEVRPPNAASPMALVELVYDIEDSAEGVRIWGDDPYTDQSWEVGQQVFKNWWWAFDRFVINRSNELRRTRGAPLLTLSDIVSEVE